jgi:hypothetical protein
MRLIHSHNSEKITAATVEVGIRKSSRIDRRQREEKRTQLLEVDGTSGTASGQSNNAFGQDCAI